MPPGGSGMRSDLVFGAYSHTPNRYQLCLLVAKKSPQTSHTTNSVAGNDERCVRAVISLERDCADPPEIY